MRGSSIRREGSGQTGGRADGQTGGRADGQNFIESLLFSRNPGLAPGVRPTAERGWGVGWARQGWGTCGVGPSGMGEVWSGPVGGWVEGRGPTPSASSTPERRDDPAELATEAAIENELNGLRSPCPQPLEGARLPCQSRPRMPKFWLATPPGTTEMVGSLQGPGRSPTLFVDRLAFPL